MQSLTILTCRVQFKKVKLFVYSHPPAIYLQSSHCYCIVPTRIMPCQKKCSTCHELKVSYKEVPHWLKDLISYTAFFKNFSNSLFILGTFLLQIQKDCIYCTNMRQLLWTRSYFFSTFFVNYTYSICVSFFLLFLNQCACFTKKQAALVAEWVPKIWFSSTYLLEFERWNKPWNGLKATWTRFTFNLLYFSKFCMYVHTSNGTCNFEKSSIMIWNR